MPEDNLYSAYKAGGKIEGEYTSGIQEVQDTWSDLDYNKRLGSARQDKLSKAVDTIGAGLQLGSTVYGGWQDKQKFEGESMPAAQQMIAKESYDAEKHGGINWETFQKGDKYEDYLGGFAPKKVEMSMFDSLFADEASYTIGDQEFKKSDISLMGKISKAESLAGSIGSNTRDVLDAQQSMADEVGLNNNTSLLERPDIPVPIDEEGMLGDEELEDIEENQINFNMPFSLKVIND